MDKPALKLFSTIKPSVKKQVLLKGTILSFIGFSILLYGATFISLESLKIWGIPMILLALSLMSFGLLPYRKLTKLENYPHQIILTDHSEIYYLEQGNPIFKFFLNDIEDIAYLDDEGRYGIGIWLKKPAAEKITLLNSSLNLEEFIQDNQKNYLCDIFFPYFSKQSYNELNDFF